jgi:PadR family transcriptional regulator, regulatory protein AphA
MSQPEAYPITYGMLGLLAFWGPLSGYDIKRLFDHTLAPMWGAAHSQIYKELRRMHTLGWVEMKREEQESRPDRKVYSITAQGLAALRAWQAQPPEVFQIRDELLLKILFGAFASPADLMQHVRASIASHELRLLEYRQNALFLPMAGYPFHGDRRPNPYANESPQDPQEDPYWSLIVRFAIDFEKTYIRWLYEVLKMLEGGQAPPPPSPEV